MLFTYQITFGGQTLTDDPRVGTLLHEETLQLEEGIEPLVVARTYQRELHVEPANLFRGVKREQALAKLQESRQEKNLLPGSDEFVDYILEITYIPLEACSVGEIPTFHEYAHILSDEDAEKWGALVRAVNPHWWGDEKKN